jgi:[protein-PII] uridylyltransferase
LIFSALLHDIGKGQSGDHSEVGAGIARLFAERIGLDVEGTRLLEWLVLNHLLMADTATRRDLADPATVKQFVALVPDAESVILLHALTVGDSRATGPAAWGSTKAALVLDLRERALLAIRGGDVTASDVDPFIGYEDLIAGGVLAVEWREIADGGLQCSVIAPDRPGLLGGVAASLALAGLDISSVNAATHASGIALEIFTGADRFGRLASDHERSIAAEQIGAACRGEDFSNRLIERAAAYRSPTARRSATSVTLDSNASATATVVEVYADDEVGRFAQIAMIISESGADVTAARATTIGDRIVDVFYVQISGEKIEDGQAIEALRQAIISGLGDV